MSNATATVSSCGSGVDVIAAFGDDAMLLQLMMALMLMWIVCWSVCGDAAMLMLMLMPL